jgi:hypothetical protein
VPPCISAIDSLPSRARRPFLADLLLDLGKAHLVGVAQDRHHEALGRAGGDAHMNVVLVDDVGAVDLGVDLGHFLQRVDAALVKKDMKPSRTPCFFSNRSLYWLRSAMTSVMSTSL